jgi:SAM-dependent methyltransferase
MDEITRYNIERWNALVAANAVFTRPVFDLDGRSAHEMIDPERRLGTVAGSDVLCLACGGGQQSVAFALLGANVTVVDLSEAQLEQDHLAAAHYGLTITLQQSDMRNLAGLEAASFDIVYHAYSLGFVPDARVVFQQVARVIRPNGRYYFSCGNPFGLGLAEPDWNGEGYTLRYPYINGAELHYDDPLWVYDRSQTDRQIPPVREYRHTLSALVSGLVEQGFLIEHISDYSDFTPDPDAKPGTHSHLTAIMPPWLSFWTVFRPDPRAKAG